jgi:hypothetical protein
MSKQFKIIKKTKKMRMRGDKLPVKILKNGAARDEVYSKRKKLPI